MRLFQRIGDMISANLNELVEKFEDPELGLKLAVREMEEAVDAALNGAVKAVANEKLLAKQVAENQRRAERWQQRAKKNVVAGHDELARRAIARKIQHDKLAAALEDQHAIAADVSSKLRRQISGMQAKLAEARRKLATLIARKRAAEARRQLLSISCSDGQYAALGRFNRFMEKIELTEAENSAFCELVGEDDEELFEDDESAAIEHQLAAMKELAEK